MRQKLMIPFAVAVLLQVFFSSSAISESLHKDRRLILSNPGSMDRIVRQTTLVHYARVVDSRRIFKVEREKEELPWVKRRPVLGGMLIGMAGGFTGGLMKGFFSGHPDFTVGGRIVFYGGIGAGVGAGVGALVGKMISER